MIGVGDLVVCVNDKFASYPDHRVPNIPNAGMIYTVREFIPAFDYTRIGPQEAIRLEEIINPPYHWSSGLYEYAFATHRFRPVHKSSIEIFQQIAANPKQKVIA